MQQTIIPTQDNMNQNLTHDSNSRKKWFKTIKIKLKVKKEEFMCDDIKQIYKIHIHQNIKQTTTVY